MTKNNWLRRITRVIGSVKLASVLLAGLIFAAFYASIVSRSAFSSWWFITLVVMLAVNTSACTLRQWRGAVKRYKQIREGRVSGKPVTVDLPASDPADALATLAKLCRAKWYAVSLQNSRLVAHKNAIGVFGSALFHTALVALIFSAFCGVITGTWGRFGVSERFVFSEAADNYVVFEPSVFAPQDPRRFTLELEKLLVETDENGRVQRFASQVNAVDNKGLRKTQIIRAGSPLVIGGVTIYQHRYGYSPIFTLVLKRGDVIDFIVELETFGEPDEEQEYSGHLVVPGTSCPGYIRFYPGQPVKVAVTIEEPAEGTVTSGVLALGEWLEFSQGRLYFVDWRYWGSFTAVGDSWRNVTFTAFWVALGGLIAMYIINPRTIRATATSEGQVQITASSCRFSSLLQAEIRELARQLQSIGQVLT